MVEQYHVVQIAVVFQGQKDPQIISRKKHSRNLRLSETVGKILSLQSMTHRNRCQPIKQAGQIRD